MSQSGWNIGQHFIQCSKYDYTTFTNISMNYLMMYKVYTDVGGIK